MWKLYPLFKDVNYIGYIYIYILRKWNLLMLCQKSKLTLSLMNPTFLKNWDIFYQPSWTAYFNCISMREEKLNEKHEINKFVEICLKSFDLCIRKTHFILIKKFDNKICKSLYIYIYIDIYTLVWLTRTASWVRSLK